jgi:hypothetical protein
MFKRPTYLINNATTHTTKICLTQAQIIVYNTALLAQMQISQIQLNILALNKPSSSKET